MAIRYSLFENHLTSDPNDYCAKVAPTRIAEFNEIIDRMVERGSTITRADIVGVLEDFEKAVNSMLLEGANVNLPFANFNTSIKGVFNGQTDSFDSARHTVHLNLQAGKSLKELFSKNVECQKDETVLPSPNLVDFVDLSTGERNSLVTPANMGQIIGSRLKFNSVEEEGIFFIAADNSEVKVSVVGKNKPGELMFLIPPELSAGDYTLEVRAAFGDTIRTGRLKSLLSIA